MTASTFTTTVHPFPSPTPNASAYEIGLSNAKNALVVIGGLGDGPHTIPYPRAIAKTLEETHPELSYSVFELRLTSSFSGWGFASLKDDVADISALVKYLRSIGREKIVLMGHSTGCQVCIVISILLPFLSRSGILSNPFNQDCMEYSSPAYSDLAPVDGFILQAPVSDREAHVALLGPERLERSLKLAKEAIDAGRGYERVPPEHIPKELGDAAISCTRWYSLAAAE
jgi:hypothetical protein